MCNVLVIAEQKQITINDAILRTTKPSSLNYAFFPFSNVYKLYSVLVFAYVKHKCEMMALKDF